MTRWMTQRLGLACVAGLLWAAAFPNAHLAGCAWIAPGFLLALAIGQNRGEAFRLGYAAGISNGLAALYWLLLIPFPAGAVGGWLALSAYVALYPAVWVWICLRLLPTSGGGSLPDPVASVIPQNGVSPYLQWPAALERLARLGWAKRAGWSLACAVAWTALEIIRGRFLSGFPWNYLGTSQYELIPLIQIASVTGVYGVSFFVVWISTSLLCAVAALILSSRQIGEASAEMKPLMLGPRWTWAGDVILPFVAVGAIVFWGTARVAKLPVTQRELKVALIQPSIPQELIWDQKETTNRFNKLVEISRNALEGKPDLLIWPEAALPDIDAGQYGIITNMVATHHVWMIFGADDVEQTGFDSGKYRFYNSCFLLDPRGRMVADYRKRKLVIFGEYVPLSRWLPFLKHLTPIEGGFTPGDRPAQFHLPNVSATLAPLICFEDVFPHLAPEYVTPETDFLLNLTNNGWFGESSAQWQHAVCAVFRAVENGLPLVRCTNNGLTCWIDAAGRLRDVFFDGSRGVYGPGFKSARIPLLADGGKHIPTYYQKHGDVFGWSCLALTALALMIVEVKRIFARKIVSSTPAEVSKA